MVNKAAYEKLVNEDCKKYHLDKGEESDLFEWCPDCREINLWTYWQGKDAKDVKIMVVGQDWGNYHLPKNTQTMENIREHRNTDKNKKGIELMIQDWKEIKKYLEDKDIFLNLKPVN